MHIRTHKQWRLCWVFGQAGAADAQISQHCE
jgi:hypothetical protein